MKKHHSRAIGANAKFSAGISTVLSMGLLLVSGVFAADETPAPPGAALTPLDPNKIKIVSVTRPNENKKVAGIGDRIDIGVENLADLINYSKCLSSDGRAVTGCTQQAIALFLEGKEMKELPQTALALGSETTPGYLQFDLEYMSENRATWVDLLGGQFRRDGSSYLRPVSVGLGFKDGSVLIKANAKDNLNLTLLHLDPWFFICLALLALVIAYLIALARYTGLLRNPGPVPDSPIKEKKWWMFNREVSTVHRPYSTARVQMAFWFTLVISAFLYLWLVTGSTDTITTTVLALIGIGAGTALGSAAIDASKKPGGEDAVNLLKTEEAELQTDINALNEKMLDPTNAASVPDLQADKDAKSKRLGAVQELITKYAGGTAVKPKVSDNFLIDVLTDENGGISFHRFQMLTWTLILGVIFVYKILNEMAMPDFPETLLALLGISNGTYLGFKIPETTTTPPPAP